MKMKDSGVEWIGEIPEGWEVRPLKSLFSFGKGLPITKENLTEKGISVISYGQIHSKKNSGTKLQSDLFRYVDSSYLESGSNFLVHKGDFIFADTSEDLEGCGNCVYVDDETELFAGYHTVVLQTKESNENKYLAYLFKTDEWRKQIREKLVEVKLYSITRKVLKTTTVILPPKETQQKIATYLDEKCSQIEQTIQNQQKIIEKLKEYKQAVITEAVDNPSYTKWNLGYLSTCKNGLNYVASDAGEKYKFLNVGDFQDYFVLDKEEMFSDIITTTEIDEDYYLQSGDIVFVRSNGSKELVGRAIMVENINFPVTYSGFCIRLRNIREDIVDSKYWLYFFRSFTFRNDLTKYSQGSNISNINQDLLSHIKIAIPALEKQKEIVEDLNRRCKAIDESIEKKQQIIEKLAEYKKSLIYECVTGKKEI